MIYGVDVSAYQPNFDFAACAREGFDFAIIKCTEGTSWRSAYFHAQWNRARAAGLLTAAYHYVRGTDVAGQMRNIRAMVGTDVPVILDVEEGAGPIGSIRALNAALNEAGYRTPLIYVPQWYWRDHMGRPDLRGLPPNWHSRYPDNVVRRKEGFTLGPEYWPTFGGLHTEVAQFTSSLAVANYPNGRIDGNAYRGTREELAALLEGDDMPSAQEIAKAVWEHPLSGTDKDAYTTSAGGWLIGTNANTYHLLQRAVADVDEDALAAAMEARGIGGANVAQVKAALAEVLRKGVDGVTG